MHTWHLFHKAGLYAIQDKPEAAAQAYADRVASKQTRSWFWVDHLPYFSDMRKQPDYIKARVLLMQDLANQRAMLAEYRATGVMP